MCNKTYPHKTIRIFGVILTEIRRFGAIFYYTFCIISAVFCSFLSQISVGENQHYPNGTFLMLDGSTIKVYRLLGIEMLSQKIIVNKICFIRLIIKKKYIYIYFIATSYTLFFLHIYLTKW